MVSDVDPLSSPSQPPIYCRCADRFIVCKRDRTTPQRDRALLRQTTNLTSRKSKGAKQDQEDLGRTLRKSNHFLIANMGVSNRFEIFIFFFLLEDIFLVFLLLSLIFFVMSSIFSLFDISPFSFLTSCKILSLFVVLEKKSAHLSLSFVSQHA